MNAPIKYHAAGGVVIRENGRMMLLLEVAGRKELRLPKGHIEDGETVEQAAVREVQEETGYADVEIIDDLGSVTHTFYNFRKDANITRTESYFLMRLNSDHPYNGPQYEHERFKRRWVRTDDADRLLTYESEREFARRARQAILSGKR
jgi:8-oxo-dGTP pyrophosphatase MutT (NUDIX family)